MRGQRGVRKAAIIFYASREAKRQNEARGHRRRHCATALQRRPATHLGPWRALVAALLGLLPALAGLWPLAVCRQQAAIMGEAGLDTHH